LARNDSHDHTEPLFPRSAAIVSLSEGRLSGGGPSYLFSVGLVCLLQLALKPLPFLPMSHSVSKSKKKKALMVGVGLDSDGHKRVTTGDNFALVGGSKDTHEAMTEKVIKINEKLTAKGKRLEEVSGAEFDDIAHSVGLVKHQPDAN
jgi:hypothetical protein